MLGNEVVIRLGVFTGILCVMILAEAAAPRRDQRYTRRQRWPHNLLMVVVDTLVVRLLFPVAAVGAAVMANEQAWGLLNLANLPVWLSVLLGTIALDLAIYFQHRIFHAVPWLWRLHRMHHADLEFDVTTGLRFHPLEIVLSMVIKISVVVALGAPAIAVLIFEVILNATSMFNHGNVRLPQGLEQKLRPV
ncbi:MAG TPA: sterol desaturase family protein, partial [Verrucomicrobiota bacterium]|nr:sterol desaturase family protein [Verrucomicrobiota bacterium]